MAKKDKLQEIEADTSPVVAEPQRVFMVRKGFNFGPDDIRVEPGPLSAELPPEVFSDLVDAEVIMEVESGS